MHGVEGRRCAEMGASTGGGQLWISRCTRASAWTVSRCRASRCAVRRTGSTARRSGGRCGHSHNVGARRSVQVLSHAKFWGKREGRSVELAERSSEISLIGTRRGPPSETRCCRRPAAGTSTRCDQPRWWPADLSARRASDSPNGRIGKVSRGERIAPLPGCEGGGAGSSRATAKTGPTACRARVQCTEGRIRGGDGPPRRAPSPGSEGQLGPPGDLSLSIRVRIVHRSDTPRQPLSGA